MNGAFAHRHGGFLDGFRQGRMRVAGARDVFRGGANLHGDGGLGNHVAGIGAENVHAEHAVGLGVGEDLDEPVGGAVDLGAAIGGKRELADIVGNAGFLQLLLAASDRGQLRVRVDDVGNDLVV